MVLVDVVPLGFVLPVVVLPRVDFLRSCEICHVAVVGVCAQFCINLSIGIQRSGNVAAIKGEIANADTCFGSSCGCAGLGGFGSKAYLFGA